MSRLEELKKREESALTPGGPDSVAAQHKAGKKTARERISALLDAASFVEIDKFVRKGYTTPGFESTSKTGEGVVCGFGTIDGRPAFVFAQDYTVLSGSVSSAHARKILKTIDMAAASGVPVIGILDSGGARVAEGPAAIDSYAAVLKRLNEISGVIPTIAVVAGECIGTAVYMAAAMDFCFAIEKIATISLHAPQIMKSTLGDGFKADDHLSARASNVSTGVAQFLCPDEEECFNHVRSLLDLLPLNNLEQSPLEVPSDDMNRRLGDAAINGDVTALLQDICDDGQFLEYQELYGANMRTALGRVNGRVVGLVANAKEATIDSAAARKAARFVSLADAFDIPIVVLTNCTGTPVSVEQPSIVRDCAGLVAAFAEAGVPMINVITGEAIGAGYAMMCPHSLGADMVYAWPDAVISALPAEAGAIVMYEDDIKKAQDGIAAKQEAIEKYRSEYANPWKAAEQGIIDDVIDPADTRQIISAALEMCQTKRVSKLPKKHAVQAL